jgi:general secretion pathway protein H
MRPSLARARHAGFTLFEILVTLTILAVLLGVAVPALRPSPAVELRGAAGTITTALRQARMEAIKQGKPLALIIDIERRSLRLEGKKKQRQLSERLNMELFTAESEMLEDKIGGIRFYPDGSSTGGRVTLEYDDLRSLVDVEWLTGRIRTLDPDA